MSKNLTIVRTGLIGGLVGGIIIWIYEAVVWVGLQGMMPLGGILRNATGLVFGQSMQAALGGSAYVIGIAIHFTFAGLWGVVFAYLWLRLRDRGVEATLLALFYAAGLWIIMHIAIIIASDNHPNYADPSIIIGGIMSHFFYAVPLGLIVKHRLAQLVI